MRERDGEGESERERMRENERRGGNDGGFGRSLVEGILGAWRRGGRGGGERQIAVRTL